MKIVQLLSMFVLPPSFEKVYTHSLIMSRNFHDDIDMTLMGSKTYRCNRRSFRDL